MSCVSASVDYLSAQIKAGAEVIQISSTAGPDYWKARILGAGSSSQQKKLVTQLKKKYPRIPVIGFPREAKPEDYRRYIRETGVDALSIDTNVDLDFAKTELQTVRPLQGNLNPALLVKGGDKV